MRRAADRVLVHANPRREEPRDEIEGGRRGPARDDHTADGEGGDQAVIRLERSDGLLVGELDQEVEPVAARR